MPDERLLSERPELVLPETYLRDLKAVRAMRAGLIRRGYSLPHAWVAEQIDRSETNVCSTLTGAIHSPGTLRKLTVLFEDIDAGRASGVPSAPKRTRNETTDEEVHDA
ncbi:MAG: hypothetical protein AAF809_03915 [Bacteroidota bacterium]